MRSSPKTHLAQLALAASLTVAAMLCSPLSEAQQADTALLPAAPPATIVPGEVIVKLRPGTSDQSRDQVLAAVDAVFIRAIDLSDLVLAKVPVGTEVEAADSLEVDPNVVFAEPNGRLQASAE